MAYTYPQKILFKHCDPAGIVFYPRYFEMMNDCVEAFFEDCLDFPFSQVTRDGGVPTAEISTRFRAPSKLGDDLSIRLGVVKLGRSSLGLRITADCEGEIRFETTSTLVLVNESGRPIEWPEQVRTRIKANMEDGDNEA